MNAVDVSSNILIHRAKHDTDHPYLKVSHAVIQDERLSVTALGLLVYLLSNKDTWRIEPSHLAKRLGLNAGTVRKLLHKLSDYGYVKLRERSYNARGQIVWTDYQVYESPQPVVISGSSVETHLTAKPALPYKGTQKNTRYGKTTYGYAAPIIRNNSNKKEKESPAETTSSRATAVLSPIGDARLGDASRSNNEQGQESFSVKVDASFKLNSLPDQDESLPGSRADVPLATPKADIPPARSAAPAQTPPAQSAVTGAKSDATPPRPTEPHPMQAAVAYAFKIPQGAYAGKIGQFFAARMPRNRKDPWASHQPQTAATPQEIIGLFLWYSRHLSYVKSCAERGGKLPSTPSILRDRLDEFRDSPTYASAMQAAAPLLDKLLRGESIAAPVIPANAKPANTMGAVESAAAYKTYDPKHDPAYQRAVDRDAAAAAFEQVFGR